MLLQFPADENTRIDLVKSIIMLNRTSAEFNRFMEWLDHEQARIDKDNREETDDTKFKWNQGAAQFIQALKFTMGHAMTSPIKDYEDGNLVNPNFSYTREGPSPGY